MDGDRFDQITRALAQPASRRGVLRALVGVLGAGTLLHPSRLRAQESPPIEPLDQTITQVDNPGDGIAYFALGDSIASGHGLDRPERNEDGPGCPDCCRRSIDAYPYRVKQVLEQTYKTVHFNHLACSGATALDPFSPHGQPMRLLETQVAQAGEAIDQAPASQPVLISVTIGANDFEFATVANFLLRLYVEVNEEAFDTWVENTTLLVRNAVRIHLRTLLERPNVSVVVTEVPNPFNRESVFFLSADEAIQLAAGVGLPVVRDRCADIACYDRVARSARRMNEQLQGAVDDLAADYPNRIRLTAGLHDEFLEHASPRGEWGLDLSRRSPVARRACCGSAAPDVPATWIQYRYDPESTAGQDFAIFGLLFGPEPWHGDCIHPNKRGAQAIAEAVLRESDALLAGLLPPPVDHSRLPEGFLGTWSGQGTQTDPSLTWPITIELTGSAIGELVGAVDYPPAVCSGALALVLVSDANTVVVGEDITVGAENCKDGGMFGLTLIDAETMRFRWTHPEFATVAEGTLTRETLAEPSPESELGNDVPMYRGNAARTGEMPGPGPDDRNGIAVIWTFATGDWVSSSPTVSDGVVYVGSLDANVYALDAATGMERWRFATDSQVYSSPAIVDGSVYVGSTDSSIYALDAATGMERWRFATGDAVYDSPAVIDSVVYIGSHDANVYALDAATGAEQWRFQTGDWVSCSPAVANGTVYVGSLDSYIYAIDAATGTERWRFQTGDWSASTPAVVDGVVYVGNLDTTVYAIDAETGAERWHVVIGSNVPSSPAVVDGVVYIGTYDTNVYALDAATGTERWRFQTGDVVLSSPAVVDGTLYIGSWDTNVYAIDAATGAERWRIATGDSVDSSPAVIDGNVYIGSLDGNVYAIGEAAEETAPPVSPSLAGLSYVLPDGLWLIGDAGRASRIVEGTISEPAWSADGSRLAYVRTLGSVDPDATDIEGFQIEVANADGSGPVVAVPNRNNPYAESGGEEGYWSLGPVKWTPDGNALVYFRGFALRGGKGLVRVDLATGAETEIVLPELLPGPFDIGADGTLAILASPFNAAASVYHLYLRDAAGQTTLLLEMPEEAPIHTPSWSPDGVEIALGWQEENLVAIDRSSGELRWIVAGDTDIPLGASAWSPDGGTIAYVVSDPNADWLEPGMLWTVPATGGVASTQFAGSYPGWRPAGTASVVPPTDTTQRVTIPEDWESGTWHGITASFPHDHWFSDSVPVISTLAPFQVAAAIYPSTCPAGNCPRFELLIAPADGHTPEDWARAHGFLVEQSVETMTIGNRSGVTFTWTVPLGEPIEATLFVVALGADILVIQATGAFDRRIVDGLQLNPA